MLSEIVEFRNEVANKLRERTEANRSTDTLQAELDGRRRGETFSLNEIARLSRLLGQAD